VVTGSGSTAADEVVAGKTVVVAGTATEVDDPVAAGIMAAEDPAGAVRYTGGATV